MDSRPLAEKWRSFGWDVIELPDGHDLDMVFSGLNDALNAPREGPCVVLAHTVAGKGVSFMEGTWQWHLGFLGPNDRERALEEIAQGLARDV